MHILIKYNTLIQEGVSKPPVHSGRGADTEPSGLTKCFGSSENFFFVLFAAFLGAFDSPLPEAASSS